MTVQCLLVLFMSGSLNGNKGQDKRKCPQTVLGTLRLDIKENFLVEGVVRHWSRLPRVVVESLNPWRDLKAMWVWHLGAWFSVALGSAGL